MKIKELFESDMFTAFYHATTDKDFIGLNPALGTAFISRDINAARDVLKNKYGATGEGRIIKSMIPNDLAKTLIQNERIYHGFHPYDIKDSSEIPLRTRQEQELFNRYIT